MKKVIKILLLFLVVSIFVGCNKKTTSEYKYKDDLRIDDFKINIVLGKEYDKDAYFINIENFSKFDILDPTIYYRVKEDEVDNISKVFESYINKYIVLFNELGDNKELFIIGSSDLLIESGKKSSDILLSLGTRLGYWNDLPNEEQLSLTEINSFEFKFVGKDNKLYLAKYNYKDKSWDMNVIGEDISSWKDSKILKDFFIPNSKYNLLLNKASNELEFISYNINEDSYDKYIELVKNIGFTVNAPKGFIDYYSASNRDGKQILIKYNSDNKTMSVKIKK